ncbi:PEP/pyruvate-binding domain-containing protein [Desulfonauticus submarinus]
MFNFLFNKMFNILKKRHKNNISINKKEIGDKIRIKYKVFKEILSLNNRCLYIMSELEKIVREGFYINKEIFEYKCISLMPIIYKMIENINILSNNKYKELYSIFEGISNDIHKRISYYNKIKKRELVLFLDEIDITKQDEVGLKMANLGEIYKNLKVSVPYGYCITRYAYKQFMRDTGLQYKIQMLLKEIDLDDSNSILHYSSKIKNLILSSSLPKEIEENILYYAHKLESKRRKKLKFSVRSSAIGEDFLNLSFAGQYASKLNISKDSLIHAYKFVVASKYNPQAIIYRLKRGISDDDVDMCVGILEMIPGEVSGIIYTSNPIKNFDDSILISSCYGLGKTVVDGSIGTDLLKIKKRREEYYILEYQIGSKKFGYFTDKDGLKKIKINKNKRNKLSLNFSTAKDLARLAEKIEKYYNCPQDIEWTLKDEKIFILQTRPLSKGNLFFYTKELKALKLKNIRPIFQRGEVANNGVAVGKVYKMVKDVDLWSIPDDVIIVVREALPKWAFALSKAKGIIVEYGSISGHLANVAREFNIPCLVNVKDALKKLHNGQEITLVSQLRSVFLGRFEELEKEYINFSKKNNRLKFFNKDTQNFRDVLELITPLNLIDPQSPTFLPSFCHTLHDLTRFIHEKAVVEMFNLSQYQDLSSIVAKQLKTNVPMQWWVLNLDNGFKKHVEGKYITLDNIQSIPMLAIWQGITAIPWDGPPVLDRKGFISLIFQSTLNPNLEPATGSSYLQKNYFMISKNFCHLQSRFGYHFAGIETVISPITKDNFIRFQFKGGAADVERKQKRALFIKEILGLYGFEVEVVEDRVDARIDRYKRKEMIKKLKILGYLLMHTRQLDIIMNDRSKVNFYTQKIKNDISRILNRNI